MGRARRSLRIGITLTVLACAAVAVVAIWQHYAVSPWTRDGQVMADVVDLAPQVSGRIVSLRVADNQAVHKGDLLYTIEPIDFEIAVATAEANLQSKQQDLALKQAEAKRRAELSTLSTSVEEQQTYEIAARVASAAYAGAVAQRNQARIDLERTQVKSPVNGYVTNLLLREGDTATRGTVNMSLLDADSFYVLGYFEETKLRSIKSGDPAMVALMAFREPLRGHVDGIARGINTPNTAPGVQGLASVNPVFTWVRLAQRIPVRIHIDEVPEGVTLAAGLTATVTIGPGVGPNSAHGLISRVTTPGG
ncbi:MAG: HlyD family secretion protein [Acidisphaera sp.]|nr:HlyD family secretion protein [Acidisphaera sp.]